MSRCSGIRDYWKLDKNLRLGKYSDVYAITWLNSKLEEKNMGTERRVKKELKNKEDMFKIWSSINFCDIQFIFHGRFILFSQKSRIKFFREILVVFYHHFFQVVSSISLRNEF